MEQSTEREEEDKMIEKGQDKNYCKNRCRYYKQIEKERES